MCMSEAGLDARRAERSAVIIVNAPNTFFQVKAISASAATCPKPCIVTAPRVTTDGECIRLQGAVCFAIAATYRGPNIVLRNRLGNTS